MSEFPRIGIRPTIDGRERGVRESLEEQTMGMATSVAELLSSTLRYPDGTPVECVIAEFRNLKTTPVPEEELRRSKDQLKGSLMLSLESSTARMSNLARQEMYYDHFYGLDELIERIEAVTIEDLQQTAEEFFRTEQIAVTILGNLTGLKLTRDQLSC